jgi:hypothetical protein
MRDCLIMCRSEDGPMFLALCGAAFAPPKEYGLGAAPSRSTTWGPRIDATRFDYHTAARLIRRLRKRDKQAGGTWRFGYTIRPARAAK